MPLSGPLIKDPDQTIPRHKVKEIHTKCPWTCRALVTNDMIGYDTKAGAGELKFTTKDKTVLQNGLFKGGVGFVEISKKDALINYGSLDSKELLYVKGLEKYFIKENYIGKIILYQKMKI